MCRPITMYNMILLFMEDTMGEQKTTAECPYCLSPVGGSDDAVECDSCGTVHHAECWSENGGCCVRTCAQVVRRIELEPEALAGSADKLVLSREAVESARPRRNPARENRCIKCGGEAAEGQVHCRSCSVKAAVGLERGLPPGDLEVREWSWRDSWPGLALVAALAAALAWLIASGTLLPSPESPEPEPLRMGTNQ